MGESAASTTASLTKLRSSLDLLHGAVARIDTNQQQMRAQMDNQARAVQDGARLHDATARALAKLTDRLDAAERGGRFPSSPADEDLDPEVVQEGATSTLRPITPNWIGNAAGGSTSAHAARATVEVDGGVTDAVLGSSHTETGRIPLPKMFVPRFAGEWPRIWKYQMMDYFHIFNINPALWLITGTLHLDGQAAMWWQAYKLQHEVTTWPQFISAVEEQFGSDDQRKVLNALVNLKQKGTVAEYQQAFAELVYKATMLNPHYDEQFFISQFIRGKTEFRGDVESQVPTTLERAYLLAQVQLEVWDDTKHAPAYHRPAFQARPNAAAYKTEAMTVKIANGDTMQCDQVILDLSWWCQGQTFTTTTRVLELGAYDAILDHFRYKQWDPGGFLVTKWHIDYTTDRIFTTEMIVQNMQLQTGLT